MSDNKTLPRKVFKNSNGVLWLFFEGEVIGQCRGPTEKDWSAAGLRRSTVESFPGVRDVTGTPEDPTYRPEYRPEAKPAEVGPLPPDAAAPISPATFALPEATPEQARKALRYARDFLEGNQCSPIPAARQCAAVLGERFARWQRLVSLNSPEVILEHDFSLVVITYRTHAILGKLAEAVHKVMDEAEDAEDAEEDAESARAAWDAANAPERFEQE